MNINNSLPLPILEELSLEGCSFFTDPSLFNSHGVRVTFAGRRGGVSLEPFASLNCGSHVGDDLELVKENRAIILDSLGATGLPLVVPNQVHGTRVLEVTTAKEAENFGEDATEADAVVVSTQGVGGLLNFADCLPLIVVAPSGAFAVIHAGWRGAYERIASIAVCALARQNGEDPATFNAYIGPHIRSCCFEVDANVADQFGARFGASALSDSSHVSIAEAVKADLEQAGLSRKRIADLGICTVCESNDYFSFRAANGTCGRQGALAFRL